MKTHNMRAALGLALAGCTLAIPVVVIEVIATAVPTHATPAQSYGHGLAACRFEDGSGQSRCVWDARTMGNGVGYSFVAFAGGTDHARYVYVSHRVARQLLGGAR